ncbi:MAG: group 1 truncated hemoglobin [Zetaproteobacteria bacterium CG06_land_8_20_14_3_00_59_53]|nr:MAG: group 1 truncated hemoglobin [Zetaproteobacteria bacterium CG2_30_59_37]PIO89155.1 MAG: group 1 truncated hemoglobin [Zetaproteobacteria bacterium CG23_combo_of_CG06-09_8_20_14_all_59_86]PIQ64467.1 MAG: group 1 truncated hemoglobin [Zetaproteobacteria bacterium CG11_big_fil_rev_8_21_14_0_20_59_439]PIU70894.1 MAG: group 1 truncated hemoglobin [Zetaproteobacteria bacterium CG06_land_8_20_14_3_00_59_53]PIU96331.1 MAG: group 1 truncated hemoglobin [Zetaproteobacteria bacterium CG03_land_8_2
MTGAAAKPAKQSLFDLLGGQPTLECVHKRFYDKIYIHPWLKQFFEGHEQAAIELRQTQFMAEKFGSDMQYPGMALELAHRRMFIPEELLRLRQSLLRESLEEEQVPEALIVRWLKIDQAFWKDIRNDSLASFSEVDLKYERPLIVNNPQA